MHMQSAAAPSYTGHQQCQQEKHRNKEDQWQTQKGDNKKPN